MKRLFSHTLPASCSTVLGAHCARLMPFSKVIGSSWAWFSAAAGLYPAAGYMAGWAGVISTSFIRLALHAWYAPLSYALLSVYHIPSLFASMYAAATMRNSRSSALTRLFLSAVLVLCCVCFMTHTTGMSAYAYALPWLFPLAQLWIPARSRFMQSLATVYSGHAVGSVLWLYMMPALTPALWVSLIPVACAERILMALTLWSACSLYDWVTAPSSSHVHTPAHSQS